MIWCSYTLLYSIRSCGCAVHGLLCAVCEGCVCEKDVLCVCWGIYLNTPTLYSTPEVRPSPIPPPSHQTCLQWVSGKTWNMLSGKRYGIMDIIPLHKNVKFTINCLFGNTSYVLKNTLLKHVYFSLSNKLPVLLRFRGCSQFRLN